MSDQENPYQIPETQVVPEKVSNTGASLSEIMLRYLKEASPWMRFIGILGFIGSGIIVLVGIILAIVLAVTVDAFADSSTWLVSLLYLPMGVLLFFPSLFTYRFGAKVKSYLINNLDEDLEIAFKNNKSLWKFNGILSIISLAATPVMFIITMVVGVSGLLTGF